MRIAIRLWMLLAICTLPTFADTQTQDCCTGPIQGKPDDCVIEEAIEEVLNDLKDAQKYTGTSSIPWAWGDLDGTGAPAGSVGPAAAVMHKVVDPVTGEVTFVNPGSGNPGNVIVIDYRTIKKSYGNLKPNGTRRYLNNCKAFKDVLKVQLWHEWHHLHCNVNGDAWVNYASGTGKKAVPTCDHVALAYGSALYACSLAEAISGDSSIPEAEKHKRIAALCRVYQSELTKLTVPPYASKLTACQAQGFTPPCGLPFPPATIPLNPMAGCEACPNYKL